MIIKIKEHKILAKIQYYNLIYDWRVQSLHSWHTLLYRWLFLSGNLITGSYWSTYSQRLWNPKNAEWENFLIKYSYFWSQHKTKLHTFTNLWSLKVMQQMQDGHLFFYKRLPGEKVKPWSIRINNKKLKNFKWI